MTTARVPDPTGSVVKCDVCGRTSYTAKRHPCAFERACACWRGVACGAESRGADGWARTARIARKVAGA